MEAKAKTRSIPVTLFFVLFCFHPFPQVSHRLLRPSLPLAGVTMRGDHLLSPAVPRTVDLLYFLSNPHECLSVPSHPRLTDGDTEAQRHAQTCPRSHKLKVGGLRLEPRPDPPKAAMGTPPGCPACSILWQGTGTSKPAASHCPSRHPAGEAGRAMSHLHLGSHHPPQQPST